LVAFDFRKSIRFSVLSGSEIRKSAEVQVWNNRIYGHDMKPVPNGLLDPRMVMPRSELLFSRVYFH
jgi:DNA-directed RNA polymerase III subunit RPC1